MKKLLLLLVLLSIFTLPIFMKKTPVVEDASPNPLCELFITVNNAEITLDDYLLGVLAGEMPASFHEEALKAQAIAARTYVLKQTRFGMHEIAATTAHQVFLSKEAREEKWQAAFHQNEQKLAQAIIQTKNEVITYNDELITAMFHASSYEKTESAKNYSDYDVPYLQSVTSLEPLEVKEVFYTYEELNERLKRNFSALDYERAKITTNSSGRVQSIHIAGQLWSGRELREQLQLRATNFTWQPVATGVQLKTLGYGHGVGMSQEGAQIMANNGRTAAQILMHYYPHTTLQTIDTCKK